MRFKIVLISGLIGLLPVAVASARQGIDDSAAAPSTTTSTTTDTRHSGTDNGVKVEAESHRTIQLKTKVEDKVREARTEKVKELCSRVGDRATKKLEKIESHRNRMDERYTAVETHWQKLIDRANANGADSAALSAALQQFKAKHAKFTADFTSFKSLQANLSNQCDDPATLKAARDAINSARALVLKDMTDLRNFRQATQKDVVVPLLKTLADKKAAATNTGVRQ